MTKLSASPPSGFRDFTPHEAAVRAELIETISREYRAFGFQQIFTSACENLSSLQGKGGGQDNEKLIFKIQKRGEQLEKALAAKEELADLGLRFDLTLPLARYISNLRSELAMPFKVFHIGPVWRADRPQKGRFREFYQCDVDVVGTNGIGAEIDCLGAISAVFKAAGVDGVELHLNDRRLLQAIGNHFGFPGDRWSEFLVILDKLDKIGAEKVADEAREKFGERVDEWMPLLTGDAMNLERFASFHPEAAQNLREIIAAVGDATGAKVVFNASLVRGQDYYTGTIFEARHPAIPGSLAGGGRYDRLLEVFGGQPTPAFGGSIGFERLMMLMLEKRAPGSVKGGPQVFFPLMDTKLRPAILKSASECRARGLRVDIYPDAAKLKNQFKYADARGIPFTVLIGESELSQGKAMLKDMTKQEQREVALVSLADELERVCR